MSCRDAAPIGLVVVCALGLGLAGCGENMRNQAHMRPLRGTDFFPDGRSARDPVAGTQPRGHLRLDPLRYTGLVAGKPATVFPYPLTAAMLERGRQRYDIFCTPCHGFDGSSQGIVVKRGFKPPPSYHIERLRTAPPGHFFDVMTRGFGLMYDQTEKVSPDDRWAITAYIRALQRSQNARPNDVPAGQAAPASAAAPSPAPAAPVQGPQRPGGGR